MTIFLSSFVPFISATDLHDPIIINTDQNFTNLGFPGSGSRNDPFRIENLSIKATSENGNGIEIVNTTKYFLIKNCLISSEYNGIKIQNVSQGTAVIEGNLITGKKEQGIGIFLETDEVLVFNNTCANFSEGIHLNYADECIIVNNNLSKNAYHGLSLKYSSNNLVGHNQIEENEGYGVLIIRGSYDNRLYNNTFIDNSRIKTYEWDNIHTFSVSSQARDERSSNLWSDNTLKMGNSWSDYNGTSDYLIDGDGNAVDNYPSQVNRNEPQKTEEEDQNDKVIPGYNPFLLVLGLVGYIIYTKLTRIIS